MIKACPSFSFILQQGRRSTESFLRYYVVKHDPPKKSPTKVTQKSIVQSTETSSGPVNGVSGHEQNNTANAVMQGKGGDKETKAEINVSNTNGHIEMDFIDCENNDENKNVPNVSKDSEDPEELDDSKIAINEHESSKQKLLAQHGDDKT